MRPFSEFDAALPADLVQQAGADRFRSLATWAYLLLREVDVADYTGGGHLVHLQPGGSQESARER